MREQLVIIPRKTTALKKVLNILWFVLACLFLLLSTFVTPVLFLIPAIAFALLWGFGTFRSYVEYEYTYFDGDLRFAKIKNKAKRKRIASVSMNDVQMIAPKGDRSVYKYENDDKIPCKKLVSGDSNAKIYELICKTENSIIRYEFEPYEAMLDAIMGKNPRVVTK